MTTTPFFNEAFVRTLMQARDMRLVDPPKCMHADAVKAHKDEAARRSGLLGPIVDMSHASAHHADAP